MAAFDHRPESVERVFISKTSLSGQWKAIAKRAEKLGVRLETSSSPKKGDALFKAQIKPRFIDSEDAFLQKFEKHSANDGVWLVLDCLQDPQNVGAILRLAAFFNVHGVIMTQDRSSALSSVVYDVACGGMEVLPMMRSKNLVRTLKEMQSLGGWVLASSEHAKKSYLEVAKDRPWCLVIGNEESGVRPLVERQSDETCCIPAHGKTVTSLNASVATGILVAFLS